MVPTEKYACQSFKYDGQPRAHYSRFAPLVFSVEHSLPLVKLGQADRWQPDPNPENPLRRTAFTTSFERQRNWQRWLPRFLVFFGLQADPNPEWVPSRLSRWGTSARFLRWFLWIQILRGWLLATLCFAGVTGIVCKE
jgi:hypothetical protein